MEIGLDSGVETGEDLVLRQIAKEQREANKARNKAQKKKLNRHARKTEKSKRSKVKH